MDEFQVYQHGVSQQLTLSSSQVFFVYSLAQLEMAWCMNPKGRTGQLVPTQIDLYFSLLVWSGWFI